MYGYMCAAAHGCLQHMAMSKERALGWLGTEQGGGERTEQAPCKACACFVTRDPGSDSNLKREAGLQVMGTLG